jgi:hypothetical protein
MDQISRSRAFGLVSALQAFQESYGSFLATRILLVSPAFPHSANLS